MINYNEHFKDITKRFAIETILLTSAIPFSDSISIIRKQLIRSVTSTAANYRAVCRARSDNEKFSKLCLVVEEADETLFWLEVLEALSLLPSDKIKELIMKAEEIVKVMSSYRKSLKVKKA